MKVIKKIFEFLLNFMIVHLFIGPLWLNSEYGHTTGEEKIFHLLVPLDGVNPECYLSYFLNGILPSIIIAIVVMLLIRKIIKKKLYIYIPFFICSLCFAFYELDLSSCVYNNIKKSEIIEQNYIDPKDVKIEFRKKKNLIYIMLESMENTYASKENGGYMDKSLIPNLTSIANANINFSNREKMGGGMYLEGTNFTVASMLAQTSAVPLKLNVDLSYKYDFEKFYVGTTLGDILHDNGYNNYILMGSNSKYGARDVLFKKHHYNVSDVNTAIDKGKMTKEDVVWWGYSDKDLFKYAKEDLLRISKNNELFNYTMLTVDTHFEDGYMDENCEDNFDSQYANVIYCNDSMINDFIQWVKEQDFYNNTVIVLVGDHLSMDTDFFNNVSKDYVRTTYNVFINTDYSKQNINTNRSFSQLDMLPTTIGAIGGNIEGNRLGLGSNLFSNEQTLIEKYGYEYVKKELNKRSDLYNTLMALK